jgi:thioredoxin-like negative regulator of GroEL
MNNNNSGLDIWESKYLKYKQKYLELKKYEKQLNKNVMYGGSSKKDKLYLFKAEWCGHCKNFKSTWAKLQEDEDMQNKVEFVTYDADNHKNEISKFGIEGFPTIILHKGDKTIEFNGQRDLENLKNFVNSY